MDKEETWDVLEVMPGHCHCDEALGQTQDSAVSF